MKKKYHKRNNVAVPITKISVEVQPGFYMTPTNDYVYYLYVANNGRIDKKYFAQIKAAIEKIVNHEKQ